MKTTILKKCRLIRIVSLLLILLPFATKAQKVSEVLDVGPDEIIQGRAKFLLKFNGKALEYDFWGDEKTRFRPLKDSVLFLSKQGSLSVYIRPVNPLNFSYDGSVKFTPNAINDDATTALVQIGKSLATLTGQAKTDNDEAKAKVAANNKAKVANAKKGETVILEPEPVICQEFNAIVDLIQKTETLLKKDQKGTVKGIFNELKDMKFEREQQTKQELEKIAPKLEPLETDLGDIKKFIGDLETLIAAYNCPPPSPNPYISKFVFNSQLALIKTVHKEQTDRYNNLKKCLDLVTKAYNEASASDEGLKWMIEYKVNDDGNNLPVNKKTVSNFTATINENGFKLSDKDEIVAMEKKEKVKILVRVLKFQRFIPEVTPGVAYSFLKFPKFGVTTNATGQQIIAEAGEENFKRINFSAMVNFNYFVPQSAVQPFLQIGIGANTDYPSFFTGAGFRFDIGSGTIKALSISGGMVSTWIKTLKTLHVGDVVKGTAELEKDITHEFKWPPKAYVGIQLKF